MQAKKLPIGYWIKQVDNILTKGIDDIQSSFGMTRTNWQILNIVSESETIDKIELTKIMSPFLGTDLIDGILTKLKERHLIDENDQKLILTDKGKKQHSLCLEKQKLFRKNTMTGISEQDYQVTVLTLQKIIENNKANSV